MSNSKDPMPWLKLWHNYLDSAKVQSVTEALRARYVALLCVTCRCDLGGALPDICQTAFMLRMTVTQLQESLDELVKAKLIDKNGKHYRIHDWSDWQGEKSPGAIRQKRYRQRRNAGHNAKRNALRNALRNAPSNALRQEEEKEKDKEEEGNPPSPLPALKTLGPEYQTVGQWAIEVLGDFSWGPWVDDQGRFGHPADWIKLAIQKAVTAGKRDGRYIGAILQAWQREGGPPKPAAVNGRYEQPAKQHRLTPEQQEADRAYWGEREGE